MPLGTTTEQKINDLQQIKDAMAESLFNCLNSDCSLSAVNINWLQGIYQQADYQITQLQQTKIN